MVQVRDRSEVMRSFVFGVEDSVVSTVGLLSGIAAIGTGRTVILLTGVILIFVEAFSMAVGDLVSDNAVNELKSKSEVSYASSVLPAFVMFASYIFSGFAVLLPYVFIEPTKALFVSVGLSMFLLFLLGVFNGKLSRTSLIRNGVTMAAIGGFAIVVGVLAGVVMQSLGLDVAQ